MFNKTDAYKKKTKKNTESYIGEVSPLHLVLLSGEGRSGYHTKSSANSQQTSTHQTSIEERPPTKHFCCSSCRMWTLNSELLIELLQNLCRSTEAAELLLQGQCATMPVLREEWITSPLAVIQRLYGE